MRVAENILSILAECKIEDCVVYLPPEQLDRKTYESVNKCLVNIGGKWNRKTKGHVFDCDPTEAFGNLMLTGETEDMKKTFQFFPTPRHIAELVCDMAELDEAQSILEPSCGKGDLADVAYSRNPNIVGIELNREMKKYLDDKPYTCMVGNDFLEYEVGQVREFDRVVMTPPFSKQQDIDHIYHAYDLLSPGGILVSVVSPSPFFRTNNKSVRFREWIEELDGEVSDVGAGEFKTSGTMISTKIIKLRKPE